MSAVQAVAVEVPHGRGKPRPRKFDWPQIAAASPVLAATMLRYLDQIALSLRPSSVVAANGMLRQFAGFLTTEFPEIGGLVDVDRHHIEAFKRHLGTRDSAATRTHSRCHPSRSGSRSARCARSSNASRNGTTPTPQRGC